MCNSGKCVTVILWTLVGANLLTLVLGGLVTWLGYTIPIRLKQFGLSPEWVVWCGLASLLVAWLGLCALNYSSQHALNAYGLSCALLAILLIVGAPPSQPPTSPKAPPGERRAELAKPAAANATSAASAGAAGGLVLGVIRFGLITSLLVLVAFALVLARHFRRGRADLDEQQLVSCAVKGDACVRFAADDRCTCGQNAERNNSDPLAGNPEELAPAADWDGAQPTYEPLAAPAPPAIPSDEQGSLKSRPPSAAGKRCCCKRPPICRQSSESRAKESRAGGFYRHSGRSLLVGRAQPPQLGHGTGRPDAPPTAGGNARPLPAALAYVDGGLYYHEAANAAANAAEIDEPSTRAPSGAPDNRQTGAAERPGPELEFAEDNDDEENNAGCPAQCLLAQHQARDCPAPEREAPLNGCDDRLALCMAALTSPVLDPLEFVGPAAEHSSEWSFGNCARRRRGPSCPGAGRLACADASADCGCNAGNQLGVQQPEHALQAPTRPVCATDGHATRKARRCTRCPRDKTHRLSSACSAVAMTAATAAAAFLSDAITDLQASHPSDAPGLRTTGDEGVSSCGVPWAASATAGPDSLLAAKNGACF